MGKRFTGGEVITKHFKSREDARNWVFGDAQKEKADAGSILQLRERAGSTAFELSSAQISEAINAFKRLKKVGMTLTEAVDFALKHSRPDAGTISVSKAIEKALARKKSRRPSYIADLGKRWRRFERWLPAVKRKAINTVGKHDIRKFLTECDLSLSAEKNMLRNLSVLFSWAVQHHYMTENPCAGMKVEQSISEEPPRILSIPEAKKLLALAQQPLEAHLKVGKDKVSLIKVEPGELIPWLTLGMYAGLRPEETKRLDWSAIDFNQKQIIVPASVAKGRMERPIPLEPNLVEWLQPYRPTSGKGKIVRNFRWHFQVLQKGAGPAWNPWPKDVLRHSYASYLLGRDGESGRVSENLGHRNPNTLYRFYRAVVRGLTDIDKYWALVPGNCQPEN